jgi:Protein of unknown function (DUF1589)
MSEPAGNDRVSDVRETGTEWSTFLGYTELSPEGVAEIWREHHRASVEYEDLFEDDDDWL